MEKPVIKLALLSTDHEDMEGYEGSLRTLFEQTVTTITHFSWATDNPRPTVQHQRSRGGFHEEYEPGDRGACMLHLYFPKRMEREVSLFQELFTNTLLNREYGDPDFKKTFTLALYELVPGEKPGFANFTLGRIKLFTNICFPQIGIGHAKYGGQETPASGARFHDVPVDWKSIPDHPRVTSIDDEDLESNFSISCIELMANAKARAKIADIAGAVVEFIPGADQRPKRAAKK